MMKTIKILMNRFLFKALLKLEHFTYRSFNSKPLTDKILANKERYIELWEEEIKIEYKEVNELENRLGFSIDQTWFHELGLLTQVNIMKYKICYQHGRVLYTYLRNYLQNTQKSNINILETGTARGFSSLCMAKALSDHDVSGRITTLDVIPNRKKILWNCISDVIHGKVTRYQLLNAYKKLIDEYIIYLQGDSKLTLNKLDVPRVNFAFLDAVHNYEYVDIEFSYIQDRQKKGDIVIFDDYTIHFPGVMNAVDELCEKYDYDKIILSINEENGFAIAKKN